MTDLICPHWHPFKWAIYRSYIMRLKTIFAVFLTASTMLITSVSQAVTIEVGYPYSSLFDVTF